MTLVFTYRTLNELVYYTFLHFMGKSLYFINCEQVLCYLTLLDTTRRMRIRTVYIQFEKYELLCIRIFAFSFKLWSTFFNESFKSPYNSATLLDYLIKVTIYGQNIQQLLVNCLVPPYREQNKYIGTNSEKFRISARMDVDISYSKSMNCNNDLPYSVYVIVSELSQTTVNIHFYYNYIVE